MKPPKGIAAWALAALLASAGSSARATSPWNDRQHSFDAIDPAAIPFGDYFLTEVQVKYAALPKNRGLTFQVRAARPELLEDFDFESLASLVAQALAKDGMIAAAEPDYVAWIDYAIGQGKTLDPRLHRDCFTLVIARRAPRGAEHAPIVYQSIAVGLVPEVDGDTATVLPGMIRALFADFPAATAEHRLVRSALH